MAILKNILLTWSILSLFISLWDLILTILLSIDIHHYIVSHNEIQHGFAYFISIILSSKCVILWIINIVMAILIIKLYIDLNVSLQYLIVSNIVNITFIEKKK